MNVVPSSTHAFHRSSGPTKVNRGQLRSNEVNVALTTPFSYTNFIAYHLSGCALRWFESYLCGREQRVVLNGKTSGWARVGSGVPEGSICGPVLFVLFCNDLPSFLNSSCLMYADDIKIVRRVHACDDAVALQNDLNKFCIWSATWKLQLNPTKCKVMTFTLRTKPVTFDYAIHGIALDRVSVMRDLGVLMDSKLTFGPHVDSVVRGANRALGVYLPALATDLSCCKGETISPGASYHCF